MTTAADAFPRAFRLHTRDGRIILGAQWPAGRVVVDEDGHGLITGAHNLGDLHHINITRIEWADTPATCQASTISALGNPLGPCVLRPHTGPVHQDATGATWWTRTDHPKGT
ncbi:hypothetical protein [Streptomyces sp. NPDC058665]|uniref:hypothetical protein n=1 Tax=Streptomyces sp. NPDC058665 TaxID=3346586 RepID=UPI003660A57D